MVTWMVNWIPLLTKKSSGTCAIAVAASKHMRRSARWFARSLAAPSGITRPQRNYVSEFNPHYETGSPTGPRALLLREILRCCSEEGGQSCGPFFWGHHGIG